MAERISRDAVERWARDRQNVVRPSLGPEPETIVFRVSEFWRSFGLTPQDIEAEVAAGRLVLAGVNSGGEPGITLGAVMAWKIHPNTPPALLEKAAAAMKRNRVS